MTLLLALLVAIPLDLEVAGGAAIPAGDGPAAPALFARAGVGILPWLSLGVSGLGVPGPDTEVTSCGSPCPGHASFRAIAGYASLRVHDTGDLRGYLDLDAGIGHLISASGDELFEAPAMRGRGGPSVRVGAGGQWVSGSGLYAGLGLSVAFWSNVARPAYSFGVQDIPATSDKVVTGFLVLLTIGWTAR